MITIAITAATPAIIPIIGSKTVEPNVPTIVTTAVITGANVLNNARIPPRAKMKFFIGPSSLLHHSANPCKAFAPACNPSINTGNISSPNEA